ncbi:MAG: hypothetical protein A2Y12_08550 [Planctomycetes bacterium GWF2_42_9]|nr:MAG: hypothetical protein A2Y12_08550 [Planctomycetes bacterium GWF2_42_9]
MKLGFNLFLVFAFCCCAFGMDNDFKQISKSDYIDKVKGGWLGQIAGVTWGYPTEFAYMGKMASEVFLPKWKPAMINEGFCQDDMYVEMTFLRTLETYGFDVSLRQIGIDFANSEYGLCHANDKGRWNLRKGIAPPDCSHPKFNEHADDIDYQIEADFSGLIAPGMPDYAIEAGEKFGRLVCYGDGVYGGQFVGAMYSLAFFETDMQKVVKNALAYIPAQSQYYECISDVIKGFEQNPNDWRKTWNSINAKYHKDIEYRQFSCTIANNFNIDAKINGAYIVMGLLYGRGDFENTIKISMMCGQDSDCNPSNAAGILGTAIGYKNMPEKFKQIKNDEKFYYTEYNFPQLIDVSAKLAQQLVVRNGGRSEDKDGNTIWYVLQKPVPSVLLEQSNNPRSPVGSIFTKEEMAKIKFHNPENVEKLPPAFVINDFAPGWRVIDCGDYMLPGLYDEWDGHKSVLVTHPYSQTVPCVIATDYNVPADGKTKLHIIVGHHYMGNFVLIVKADGKELLNKEVSEATATKHFLEEYVDLCEYKGKTVKLELFNQANGWACESAYWDVIEFVHE